MLRYALMFAAFHLPLAFFVGWVVRMWRLHPGGGLGLVVTFCAASLVGWLFVRKHKRLFTDGEKWRLITGCLVYLVFFECFALYGSYASLPALSVGWWVGVAVYTLGLDLLGLWVSLQFGVRRMMQRHLAG